MQGNSNSGIGNASEYMVSALPWVTSSSASSSPREIDFPYVSSFVSVQSTSGSLRVGFTVNGANGSNYFTVPHGSSRTFDLRVKKVVIRSESGTSNFDVLAGLTLIPAGAMPTITGSASAVGPQSFWPGVG